MLPYDIAPRINITHFTHDSKMEAPTLEIFSTLEGVKSRLDDETIKREASIAKINQVGANITIYTDGSAHKGTNMVAQQ